MEVMSTKEPINLSKAIEGAIKLGFNKRFVLRNGMIHSLLTNKGYSESEYAVVKSFRVALGNDYTENLFFVVLNDGTLGFLLKPIVKRSIYKRQMRRNYLIRKEELKKMI